MLRESIHDARDFDRLSAAMLQFNKEVTYVRMHKQTDTDVDDFAPPANALNMRCVYNVRAHMLHSSPRKTTERINNE